jgi:amino acid permease
MFLIIPAIIVFLASSYLYVNDDVSMIIQGVIYFFIVIITLFSFYLYRSIQKNLQQQEHNKILLEINKLQLQLKNMKNEKEKRIFYQKIEKLEKEVKNNNF